MSVEVNLEAVKLPPSFGKNCRQVLEREHPQPRVGFVSERGIVKTQKIPILGLVPQLGGRFGKPLLVGLGEWSGWRKLVGVCYVVVKVSWQPFL